MRKNCIAVGNSGEYFVAGELERRNFSVAMPMANCTDFDILIIDRKNIQRQLAIQVKATYKKNGSFVLGKKHETLNGDNIFYIFVALSDNESPTYYICPSQYVSSEIIKKQQTTMSTPYVKGAKKGQSRKDYGFRLFLPDEQYKNNWDLLRKY